MCGMPIMYNISYSRNIYYQCSEIFQIFRNHPVTQSQSEFSEETIDFNYDETELNSCNFPSLK